MSLNGKRRLLGQALQDRLHVDVDRRFIHDDLPRLQGGRLAHQPAKGADQVPQFHLPQRLLGRVQRGDRLGRDARQTGQLPFGLLLQQMGGFLETLVLQQLPDQLQPRIVFLLLAAPRAAAAASGS